MSLRRTGAGAGALSLLSFDGLTVAVDVFIDDESLRDRKTADVNDESDSDQIGRPFIGKADGHKQDHGDENLKK
jgi:hypothetical protein